MPSACLTRHGWTRISAEATACNARKPLNYGGGGGNRTLSHPQKHSGFTWNRHAACPPPALETMREPAIRSACGIHSAYTRKIIVVSS
jgi:hypothetical protein